MMRLREWINRKAKALACRAMVWTGRSAFPIHPKHLINDSSVYWFVPFLKEGQHVLDIGCGHGATTRAVYDAVRDPACITALDRDQGGVGRARALLPGAEWAVLDLDHDSLLDRLAPATFDVILLLDVLEHLESWPHTLADLRGLLNPGGRIFLSVPNQMTAYRRRLRRAGLPGFYDPDHVIEFTFGSISDLVIRSGYTIKWFGVTTYDHPWAGVMDCTAILSLSLYHRWHRAKARWAENHPRESTGFRLILEVADA